MKAIILAFIFTFSVGMLTAQTPHGLLRKGNKNYKKQEYTKAEEKYRKALDKRPSVKSNYNLGNAVYQQERFKEAVKHYESSISGTQDKKLKSDAYHNMGNAYMNGGETAKAIDSYKEALRLNPKDMDTKHNLTMALQQKRKQEQKEKNKQENKQDKNQKDKNDSDKQKKQEEQDGKEEQQGEQQQPQQPQDQEKEQKPEKGQGQELNRQEAKKLLQIMNDEERKVQEKLRRGKAKMKKSEKDW